MTQQDEGAGSVVVAACRPGSLDPDTVATFPDLDTAVAAAIGLVRDGNCVALADDETLASAIAALGDRPGVLVADGCLPRLSGRADVTLTDLGLRRLRDLGRPRRVHRLQQRDLPEADVQARGLESYPNNLPAQLTPLVGRRAERAEVARLLRESRLVTLTGPGGAGKTRLALHVAADVVAEYADGVWFVDLSSVDDPVLLAAAVSGALGVVEADSREAPDALVGWASPRQALVVFDNCEQLVTPIGRLCARMLAAAPGLTVLATSREALGLAGETSYRVPALEPPSAAQLFEDRARRVQSAFAMTVEDTAAVDAIVRRLGGLPLAIELAAAQTRLFTPAAIAADLEGAFHLLGAGASTAAAEPRQRTLEASVRWSYDLLSDNERVVLRRMSVFAGGFDVDAAEAVCTGVGAGLTSVLPVLTALVDKSLVVVDDNAPSPRLRLLEPIRHFALERLTEEGAVGQVRYAHCRHFLALAEASVGALESGGTARDDWLMRLDAERENMRVALGWAMAGHDHELKLRFVAALILYWIRRGTEGRLWSDLAMRGADRARPQLRVYGFMAQSFFCADDMARARSLAEQALELALADGDPRLVMWARTCLGLAARRQGDAAVAEQMLIDAVADTDPGRPMPQRLTALQALGFRLIFRGDLHRAGEVFDRAMAEAAETHDVVEELRVGTGALAMYAGNPSRARVDLEHALETAVRASDGRAIGRALGYLAQAHLAAGDESAAQARFDELLSFARTHGPVWDEVQAHWGLGWLALARGDLSAATDHAAHMERTRTAGATEFFALHVVLAAELARLAGPADAARAAADDAMTVSVTAGSGLGHCLARWVRARVARSEDQPEQADELLHEALAAAVAGGIGLFVPDLLEEIACQLAWTGRDLEAARLAAAAAAVRSVRGLAPFPLAIAERRAELAALAQRLDAAAYADAVAEGSRLDLDAAVRLASRGRGERRRPATGWGALTPTELEVAKLVADDCSNAEIASKLFVSVNTVKTHLSHIYAKLDVSGRTALALEASRRVRGPVSG